METKEIVEIVKVVIQKLGIAVDDVDVIQAAGHTLFTVRTKDSGALIGTRGDTLSALNHIIKKVFENKSGDPELRFVIDVNGYHLKHIKMLETQAHMLAERARMFQYDIEMSPMSAYDRLIVHSALSESPRISTESQGEGKMRHIVIRYKGEAAPEATPAGLQEGAE